MNRRNQFQMKKYKLKRKLANTGKIELKVHVAAAFAIRKNLRTIYD